MFFFGLYENFTGQLCIEGKKCIFEHSMRMVACSGICLYPSVCAHGVRKCLCAIQTSSSLRIRSSTKNVLCCQIATALKELNGDNSVVIKFPVYFPRSHLQVFLRDVALRQMPTIMPLLIFLSSFSFLFHVPYY